MHGDLAILLLAIAGFGLLTISDGLRQRTAVIKNEAAAMAAAEAGYEKAIYWMSQQSDMISGLNDAEPAVLSTTTAAPATTPSR